MSYSFLVTDVIWKLCLKPDVILCRKRTACVLQRPGYISTNNCPLFSKSFVKHKIWVSHVIHAVNLPTVLEGELFLSAMKHKTLWCNTYTATKIKDNNSLPVTSSLKSALLRNFQKNKWKSNQTWPCLSLPGFAQF